MSKEENVVPVNCSIEQVAEDWENVVDEQQIAQIAKRQKEMEVRQNEVQQLSIPAEMTDATGLNSLDGLQRPASSTQLQNKENSEQSIKILTFEEKQAAYQQARERIFGEPVVAPAQEASLQGAPLETTFNHVTSTKTNGSTNEITEQLSEISLDETTKITIPKILKIEEPLENDQIPKNYLSDVQMVTTHNAPLTYNTYNNRRKPVNSIGNNTQLATDMPMQMITDYGAPPANMVLPSCSWRPPNQYMYGPVDIFYMPVPANKAGLVIGKNGDTIKQICAETNAHVELLREQKNPNVKVFMIRGDPFQIHHAKHIVHIKIGDIVSGTPIPPFYCPPPPPSLVNYIGFRPRP